MTNHIQIFRLKPACALAVMLCAAAMSLAQPPATQPSDKLLREWVGQLGSDDSQIRENALDRLMHLTNRDLPALRSAAIAQSPLMPGQIAAIHEVVTEVFLAGESYRVDPDSLGGFVGLHWSSGFPTPSDGILVDERLPGFPAHRWLRPGDVIAGFGNWPTVKLTDIGVFIRIMRSLPPGMSVDLQVQRNGRRIDVPIVVDFIPVDAPDSPDPTVTARWLSQWLTDRSAKAEDFWNRQFAVIDPDPTARRSAPPQNVFAQTSSTALQP
jgi:hypothetical protein